MASGFTLIELLVVISIIALLIGILLPALGVARATARTSVCANHMRQVAVAMNGYVVDEKEFFPPAYVYPRTPWDGAGTKGYVWDVVDQTGSNPAVGYVHWTYALFGNGRVNEEAFQCPAMENGGHPATNSRLAAQFAADGLNANNAPGTIDRQADIVAFAANEMIIPRNKFFGGTRVNRLVKASEILQPSATIMVTEFVDNLGAICDGSGVSKSHRSINVIEAPPSGRENVLGVGVNNPIVDIGTPGSNFGIADYQTILKGAVGAGSQTTQPINMIGRHHPGGDGPSGLGGTTNFCRVDGSVFQDTLYNTLEQQLWVQDKYYSVTGNQTLTYVHNP